MTLKGFLLLLATVSCTVTGQVLMKRGVNSLAALGLKNALGQPAILIGAVCYVSGFVIWLNVLKILPLSIAYPFSSISYVAIIFASALFLGEALSLYKVIGMVCIIAGVFFISRG
ncbi:MAG: EamA family transporter [Spirochaetes bacterium]|nr:EamA family transporter [Spirochaetota bacterium]